MSGSTLLELNSPDEVLVASSRQGDRRAFAELWRRHYRSGLTVARQFTSIDADDLVSESFARIYKRTMEGGGPNGAFRPYLYTTIRNLACTWGNQSSRDVQVDEIDDVGEVESAEEPVARSLDKALTVSAYRSLPSRWQTVLWYTEVEGLEPHEVAPIMGLTSNAVAALAYRAREGLRKAWLQAHVKDATASGACQWVVARIGDHSRQSLTEREEQRLTGHLATCAKCSIIAEEVNDVGSRLALVLLPMMLGGVAGGTLLASMTGSAGVAGSVAAASTIPALPTTIGVATATATVGTAASVVAIAASTVFVAAVGVSAIAPHESTTTADGDSSTSNSSSGSLADPLGIDGDSTDSTGSSTSDASVDLAVTVPPSLLTPLAPVVDGVTGSNGTGTGNGSAPILKKPLDGVNNTVDGVTDVVDKVGDTVDTVGSGFDNLVDKVIPPKSGGKGSQVGEVVGGVTDTLGTVTDSVDGLVDGVVGGLGGLLGG